MGIKQSPAFAQEVMETICRNMKDVKVYIGNIGIFGNSEEHIFKIQDEVLQHLEENGLLLILSNGNGWCKRPAGLAIGSHQKASSLEKRRLKWFYADKCRPMPNKSNHGMFPRHSHCFAPLKTLTGKSPVIWTPSQQKAFDVMKAMMICDCLLSYPDHNKPFTIYTDASDYISLVQ
jgi:hypothetical protein